MVSSGFCSCFNVKIVKSTQAISSILWRLILIFQLRLWPYTSCKWTESFPERIRCIFLSRYLNLKGGSEELKVAFFRTFGEVRTRVQHVMLGAFREIFRESRYATLKWEQICRNFTRWIMGQILCEWTTLIWLFSNRNISSNQSKNFQRKQWVRKRFISTSSLSAT